MPSNPPFFKILDHRDAAALNHGGASLGVTTPEMKEERRTSLSSSSRDDDVTPVSPKKIAAKKKNSLGEKVEKEKRLFFSPIFLKKKSRGKKVEHFWW